MKPPKDIARGTIGAFMFITLDGYFKGPNEDISWRRHGREENEYSAESLGRGNTLLFGRVTYQMMAGFWTRPAASETFPAVADGMNRAEKIVFSNTLKTAGWSNARVVNGDIVEATREMKAAGRNLTLLGNCSILTAFAEAGLIDRYEIMVNPVAIGAGTSLFEGLVRRLALELINSRVFESGAVLLRYRPAGGSIR